MLVHEFRSITMLSINPQVFQDEHLFISPFINREKLSWSIEVRRTDGLDVTDDDMIRAREDFDFINMPVAGKA